MVSKLEKRGPSLGRSRKPSGLGFESLASLNRKTERSEAEKDKAIALYAERHAAGMDIFTGQAYGYIPVEID